MFGYFFVIVQFPSEVILYTSVIFCYFNTFWETSLPAGLGNPKAASDNVKSRLAGNAVGATVVQAVGYGVMAAFADIL
jgi:hypothetical protein